MNRTKIPQHVALALALAAAPVAVIAAPAHAAAPAGGCPTPYALWAISDIPAPGQPGAVTLDQQGNNDGYVCLMPYPNPDHPGAPYNGIDNRVQRG